MSDIPKSVWSELRTTFVRGAALIIPLALTAWFFRALLNAIDGILSPALEAWIGRPVPGLGFISMIVVIFLVGLLTRNLIGRIAYTWFETLLNSIPFVRGVYGGIKDLVGAFTPGGKGRSFREVVLIEYPRTGLYTIGFVTNEMKFIAGDNSSLDLISVYIANPPNPTSGMLVLVPKKEIIPVDLTIEQGLKLALSGGIVSPEQFKQRKAAIT